MYSKHEWKIKTSGIIKKVSDGREWGNKCDVINALSLNVISITSMQRIDQDLVCLQVFLDRREIKDLLHQIYVIFQRVDDLKNIR